MRLSKYKIINPKVLLPVKSHNFILQPKSCSEINSPVIVRERLFDDVIFR